jgi:peptide/nickel transport system permease protein
LAEFGRRPGATETLRHAGAGGTATTDAPPVEPVVRGPDDSARGPEREFTVEARSQWKTITRRFLRHRLAVVSLIVLLFITLLAFVGGSVWPYQPGELITSDKSTVQPKEGGGFVKTGGPTLSRPERCAGGLSSTVDSNGVEHSCAPHIMGTDDQGEDLFAQVLRGAQKSMQIAFVVAFLSTFMGVIVGAIAGYFGGFVDNVLMRAVDLLLVVPLIVLAAALSGRIEGGKWYMLAFILAAVSWTSIARIIRGEFLSLREKEFVEAARALGASNGRIMFKHMLPNVVGSIIVNATLVVAAAILIETALSYLGLGVKFPDTSLGLLISEHQASFLIRPWLFWFPGIFILLITLSVNFVGDGLRDAFDPKQTRVRA